MFTIYSADVTGNPGNCSYPHKQVILDEASLKAAICHDYVCAEYRNSYRNGDNFIGSDCLPVDCDNDHSENPEDWITPDDVLQQFPGVTFAVHFSRFNMKEKNGKAARPKFHVLFPIDYVTDPALYSDMKKLVNSIFPYFDTNALDAARFFFGTTAADVALYPGRMNLTEFLEEDDFDAGLPDGGFGQSAVIPEGSRNATMSRFAGRVIKKYGDTDEAYQAFLDEAAKCVPPLENSELNTIWHSASASFPVFGNRLATSRRKPITTPAAISRRIFRTSGRPRSWPATSPGSSAILRPLTSSGTVTITGRSRSRVRRQSPTS